jgi:hypothetical protein
MKENQQDRMVATHFAKGILTALLERFILLNILYVTEDVLNFAMKLKRVLSKTMLVWEDPWLS